MASLAELMFQAASQNIRDTKSDPTAIAKSFHRGAQLAQKQEALQMQQERIQGQKALIESKQDGKILEELAKASKVESPQLRKVMYKRIASKAEQMGRPIHEDFMQGIQAVDMDPQRISQLQNSYDSAWQESVQMGRPTPELAQARGALAASLYDGDVSQLLGLEKRETRARILQETKIQARREDKRVEFEQFPVKRRQETITTASTKFLHAGGFGKQAEIIRKATEIRDALKSGKLKTGTLKMKGLQMFPIGEQRSKVGVFAPDVAAAMDRAQSLINVKNALDSQFGDAMAVRVFSRIFDPTSPNKFNIERLDDFIRTAKNEGRGKKALMDDIGYKYQGYDAEVFGEMGAAPRRSTEQDDINTMADQDKLDQASQIIMGDPDLAKMSQDELGQFLEATIPNINKSQINAIIQAVKKPKERK